jgi:PKD repeat protein
MRKLFTIYLFLLVYAVLFTSKLYADPLSLMENKRQWDDNTLFATVFKGTDIYFQKEGVAYVVYEAATFAHDDSSNHHENHTFNAHSYKMQFVNASSALTCEGSKMNDGYFNFFLGNDPSKWASHVNSYQELRYSNVYKGIDLKYYEANGQMKYDWLVKAGQDPAQIQVRYDGLDDIELQNESLILHTSVGQIQEVQPYAYQWINGAMVSVPCKFKLNGNILSYSFPMGYDKQYELIIDPVLIFCTTIGGTSNNYGFTATYDIQGNSYGGGDTHTASGLNPSLGAFQVTTGSINDMVIVKFNDAGSTRIYATYIGGNNTDHPLSLIANNAGELYIYGHTLSNNFPAIGGYDITYNGAYDIVVIKLAVDASTIRSTFLGGNQNDGLNQISFLAHDDEKGEIYLDAAGNCYIASCTSSDNFPTTVRAYTGGQDGIVAKFNPNLNSLIWATCIGGTLNDNLLNVKINSSGEVYAVGTTLSSNFPVVSTTVSGVLSNTFLGGAQDGVIVRLNSSGVLSRAAYFGSSSADYGYFMDLDNQGNVYVMGITGATTTFPLIGSPYTSNGRNIVCKFNPNLTTTLVSTRFIGTVALTAFMVDVCGSIYVCGSGSGFPSLGTALVGSGFNLVVFSNNMQAVSYGSQFGCGYHVDGGTSRFDKNGIIYEAVCSSSCGTTTPGAYSSAVTSWNLVIIKIALNLVGMTVDYTIKNNLGNITSIGCAPLTLNFQDITTGIVLPSYSWTFGDGSAMAYIPNPVHTYSVPGTYLVKLLITDPLTCDLIDSALKTVTIYPKLSVDAGTSVYICPNQATQLTATPSNNILPLTYNWSPATALSATTGQIVIASPNSSIVYTLSATSTIGCNATDTVGIRMGALQAAPISPSPICNTAVQLLTNVNLTPNLNPFIPCDLTSVACTGVSSSVTLGTGTVTANAPYWGYWHDGRTQILILASELQAMGITGSRRLSSLELDMVTKSSTIPYNGFTIKIGCTNTNSLSTAETGLKTVYTGNVTPSVGWNVYNFSQGYVWDGISNLVIEICFDNAAYTLNDAVNGTNTAFNSVLYTYQDNSTGCNMLISTLSSTRPNLRLGQCTIATASATLSYSWSPSAGLSATNVASPIANPSATTNYTVYVSNGICTMNAPLTVVHDCTFPIALLAAKVNYQNTYYTDLNFSTNEGEEGNYFLIYRKYEEDGQFFVIDSLPYQKDNHNYAFQDVHLRFNAEKHQIAYKIGRKGVDGNIEFSNTLEVWVKFPNTEKYIAYPNPFQQNITVKCLNTLPSWETTQLKIFDLLGRELPFVFQSQSANEVTISLVNVSKGSYYLVITDENGYKQRHLIEKE